MLGRLSIPARVRFDADSRVRYAIFQVKRAIKWRVFISPKCQFMADKINYVSQEGLDALKQELHDLKFVKRPEIARRIEEAKAMGDLSENAEYHEAKDRLGFLQGRIEEIEQILKNVSVIQADSGTGAVNIGCTIEVEINGNRRTYKIVGSNEADPTKGWISNESPTGNAFLGHKVGEDVAVTTPGGTQVYRIVSIS